jgi:hypothetical protein
MRRSVRAAVALTLAALIAACPAETQPQLQPRAPEAPAAPPGGVVASHRPSPTMPKVGAWFAETGVLASAAELVNRSFQIDARVELIAEDCGRINAFYDPHTRTVTLCHELIAVIAGAFSDQRYLRQLYLYVTMHELGHALIDVLDLPVVGREEDAADQFATLFFVNTMDLSLIMGVVLAAQFFRRADADQTVYWDSHSFGEVRYYQLLCLIYGGAPGARDTLSTVLPSARADQCIAEYRQIRRGWNRLLAPHRGDRGDMFVE